MTKDEILNNIIKEIKDNGFYIDDSNFRYNNYERYFYDLQEKLNTLNIKALDFRSTYYNSSIDTFAKIEQYLINHD